MGWSNCGKENPDVDHPGYPIVLTADATLTACYPLLFDAMVVASTTTRTPGFMLRYLMPRAHSVDGRAMRAPLGLRRIEGALLRSGVPINDLAVVEEAHLDSAIGPNTKVIGVSTGEPAGRGMNSSTMTAIAGGRIVPQAFFERLMRRIRWLVARRAPKARIVLGGPGAWQLSPEERKAEGFHHVIQGYAEANAPEVFEKLRKGEELPDVVEGLCPGPDDIPSICGATTMGGIEISRGCGMGCSYCTIARQAMVHLPQTTIMRDVHTNMAFHQHSLSLLSEDIFRYGGENGRANPAALIELIRLLRSVPQLRLLQIDHGNLASVAQFTDVELATVQRLLTGGPKHLYPWVNIGVETASGMLLKRNGGMAKLGGCQPQDWGEFSASQVERLIRAGFFPFVSLMLGLPGETVEDVIRTQEWVSRFRHARLAIFPLVYAPIDGSRPPEARGLTARHWQLVRTCYRLNFRWIPRLYWDNQGGAGVSIGRRLILRLLGVGQIAQWESLLRWNHWRAEE